MAHIGTNVQPVDFAVVECLQLLQEAAHRSAKAARHLDVDVGGVHGGVGEVVVEHAVPFRGKLAIARREKFMIPRADAHAVADGSMLI